jgi:mono/diheme cytochrome c family protein
MMAVPRKRLFASARVARTLWGARGLLLALSLGACAAAPERPALVAAPGQSMEHLDAGRTLFSSHCQNCHALPEPAQLSPTAWPPEVAAMAHKSGLSQPQVALVSDYLVAASRAVH